MWMVSSDGGGSTGSDAGWRSGIVRDKTVALSFDTEQLYDPAVKPEYRNLAEYRDDYLYTMRRFLKGDDNMLSGVLYEMRLSPPIWDGSIICLIITDLP